MVGQRQYNILAPAITTLSRLPAPRPPREYSALPLYEYEYSTSIIPYSSSPLRVRLIDISVTCSIRAHCNNKVQSFYQTHVTDISICRTRTWPFIKYSDGLAPNPSKYFMNGQVTPPPTTDPTQQQQHQQKKMLLFCPQCSNTLTVSRAPETGTNRLECRTCPYQFLLDQAYYERKSMKRKEVEDVLGGEGAWDNVDQTDGKFSLPSRRED